jgi:G3E family GTPase
MMEAILLTGFLGSGKTTTLRQLLREWRGGGVGAIVNDLSDIEVDGELVRLVDVVSEKDGTLASLHAGLISHDQREAFLGALHAMRDRGLRRVYIETSGAGLPGEVVAAISAEPGITLRNVVVLVDARALLHDFAAGETLVAGQGGIEDLLVRQLQAATVIGLSKTDLIPEDQLEPLLLGLRRLNATAQLTLCTHGRLDPRVLRQGRPASPQASPEESSGTDADIGHTILRDPRPFHPQRLRDVFMTQLGLGIYRSKGFLWLASRPTDVLLWNQSGGTLGLELLGTWRASILEDPRLLPEETEALRTQLANAHPVFGDRLNELTIIGTTRDREIFCAALQSCLCTPEEITHWQSGEKFPDPWPVKLTRR